MTTREFIQRNSINVEDGPDFWYVNTPVSYEEEVLLEVESLLDRYAEYRIREEREKIYEKSRKIQYMKKETFINNGV